MRKKLGLYIHIPFCIHKCGYCGFLSFSNTDEEIRKSYVEGLIREIQYYRSLLKEEYELDTIFIGGGTPSILTRGQIEGILGAAVGWIGEECEITIEGNPKTLSREKLQEYRNSGVNRLSMGLQSTDDELLRRLGRIHSYDDFLRGYSMTRSCGFDNINVDLIFGIPGHTMELWQDTLEKVIALAPQHISCYSLQIEEGTPFYTDYKYDRLGETNQETTERMHHLANALLGSAGYNHYEISNYAKPGKICRHNLKYWSMDEYLGVGLGASSFLQGFRFFNERDLLKYVKATAYPVKGIRQDMCCISLAPTIEDIHKETPADLAGEWVFTGLRKSEGICLKDCKKYTGQDFWDYYHSIEPNINKYIEDKLLIYDEKKQIIRLSQEGIDVSNDIMADFV